MNRAGEILEAGLRRLMNQLFPSARRPPGPVWSDAVARPPTDVEVGTFCKHCDAPIETGHEVRQCPECALVLHDRCYEETEGGHAYRSPGCKSCFHRAYWR